ncbi:biotin transporter BioY [Georgenia sp. Z1491]|uniref:biotin transporter BioY n=1 Tax=Georgenia sp. Z1491 TaxID=3416707 RepID=UPI003CE9215F
MTSVASFRRAPVLADLVPGTRLRDVALVLAGTVFVTLAGWVAVPLPFTPVPVSLATFAVLLTGAALGPARAAASILVYLAAGTAGAPMFAEFSSGWAFASYGYALGYLVAAVLVGELARRRADRSVLGTAALAVASTATIYAIGVPWLVVFLGVDLATGLTLGVVPFLVGDVIKAAAAALLLPGAWSIVRRVRQ